MAPMIGLPHSLASRCGARHPSSVRVFHLLFFALLTALAAAEPLVGPASGSLFIHGGGVLTREQINEFIQLAGGVDAPFVIIPTAYPGEDWNDTYVTKSFLTRAGVKNLRVLHTRDHAVANSDAFLEPLRAARGVWIDGGRQWRLADAYLGTRVQSELQNVLARGGVIGGSSAGATIQGSYLVRGAPEGNHIMMAKGHEEGLAFLKNVAIDQHVIARKRERDLLEVIAARPELIGIGLDEGTAIIVNRDRARVLGLGKTLLYGREISAADPSHPYLSFAPGEVIDLATRQRAPAQ
jgi:cyanophycinase